MESSYLPIRSCSEIIAKKFYKDNDDGTYTEIGTDSGGTVDLKPITDRLDTNENNIDTLETKVTALEEKECPVVDLTPLENRVTTNETNIDTLETKVTALEEGGTGGGEIDPSKPLKLGTQILNIANFTTLATDDVWHTGLVKTNINVEGLTKDIELSLSIDGVNVCSHADWNPNPDGYANTVRGLISLVVKTNGSTTGSSASLQVINRTENNTATPICVYNIDGKLAIAFPMYNSHSSFNLDLINAIISDGSELENWTTEYSDITYDKHPYTKMGTIYPDVALTSAFSPLHFDLMVNKSGRVRTDPGEKKYLTVSRLDKYAYGTQSGILSSNGHELDVDTSTLTSDMINFDYTIVANPKATGVLPYRVACLNKGMDINWVLIEMNGMPYIGIEVDLTEHQFGIERLSHVVTNTTTTSHIPELDWLSGSALANAVITPIDVNNIIPVKSLGAVIAPDFQVRNEDGTTTSIVKLMETIQALQTEVNALKAS